MRLSARTRRLERAVGELPDGEAFTRGLEKMMRGCGMLDPPEPIEWDEHGLMKPRTKPPPMEPLTRAEAQALRAQDCDSLAGLMGWLMRQEEDGDPCD